MKFSKNDRKTFQKYLPPIKNASKGDLKICLLNIYLLDWNALSNVKNANILTIPFKTLKTSSNININSENIPSRSVEPAALIYFVLTS